MSNFAVPQKTLHFARDALAEIHRVSEDFFTERLRPPAVAPTKPYEVVEYIEPETGYFIYKFRVIQPFPSKMERLTAEVIANGRNAFDQAIFSACAALQKVPRSGNLHMPWSTTPNDMRKRVEKANVIPEEIRPIIYSQEPYFTGDGYAGVLDVTEN